MRSTIILCLTIGCSSRAGFEPPLGTFDEWTLNKLRDECPVVRDQSKGAATPSATVATALGFKSPVHVELECRPDEHGDFGLVSVDYDGDTRRVLRFSLDLQLDKSAREHPRLERLLSRFVDPWISVVTPQRLRELVRSPKRETVTGAYWSIYAGTTSAAGLREDEAKLDVALRTMD